MRLLSWLIALLGLWEFGDILALFVPSFGEIHAAVWNHILVGLVLMVAGAWSGLTRKTATARALRWIAVAAGLWLIASSLVLRAPVIDAGLWNDVIVGVIVVILGVWAALATPREL